MALPDFWKNHIEAWQASGLTQVAYCRQQRLNPGTFSGRLREYRAAPTVDDGPGLIPIRLAPEAAFPATPSAGSILRFALNAYPDQNHSTVTLLARLRG